MPSSPKTVWKSFVIMQLMNYMRDPVVIQDIGKLGIGEIDFASDKNEVKIYMQVCSTIMHEDAIAHEFRSLGEIDNNYSKMPLRPTSLSLGKLWWHTAKGSYRFFLTATL